MKRFTILVVTALAAAFFLSPEAEAQGVPLLCKTSLGGSGSALLTLSNLTTKTIPKGQTLFAKKGNETIKFRLSPAEGQHAHYARHAHLLGGANKESSLPTFPSASRIRSRPNSRHARSHRPNSRVRNYSTRTPPLALSRPDQASR
jgi:hypothetical protein